MTARARLLARKRLTVRLEQEDTYNPVTAPWPLAIYSYFRSSYRLTIMTVRLNSGELLHQARMRSRMRALRARRLILRDAVERPEAELHESATVEVWSSFVAEVNKAGLLRKRGRQGNE